MRKWASLLVAGAVLSIASVALSGTARAATADEGACAPEAGLNYLCGLRNVEDIVRLPSTDWLIASDLGQPLGSGLGLYLIDARRKAWQRVRVDMSGAQARRNPDCPSAMPWSSYSFHGLAIRKTAGGTTRLFAVNHGKRESIEMFSVVPTRGLPRLRWTGCVPLPASAQGNAVVGLPDGGFVVTKFGATDDKALLGKLSAGEPTGTVYRWSPGQGYREIAGAAVSGANGVEVSPDGRWLFVSAWAEHRVLRLDLGGRAPSASVGLDFLPDNLRWGSDGRLLITGQAGKVVEMIGCTSPACSGWKVAALDPGTMAVKTLLDEPGRPHFGRASVATELDGTLWFGTPHGDRIAFRSAPRAER